MYIEETDFGLRRKSPQKRAERVEKLLRYHEIGVAFCDLRGNRLLSFS